MSLTTPPRSARADTTCPRILHLACSSSSPPDDARSFPLRDGGWLACPGASEVVLAAAWSSFWRNVRYEESAWENACVEELDRGLKKGVGARTRQNWHRRNWASLDVRDGELGGEFRESDQIRPRL